MDMDVVQLAYPIETSDTLLQNTWIQRQIKKNQMVGKLEIASLAADFGGD
jgi:hypothetical protein